jgi:hypothetical protein
LSVALNVSGSSPARAGRPQPNVVGGAREAGRAAVGVRDSRAVELDECGPESTSAIGAERARGAIAG